MDVSIDNINKFLLENSFIEEESYWYLNINKKFIICKICCSKYDIKQFNIFLKEETDYIYKYHNGYDYEDFKKNIIKLIREIRLNKILEI